MGHGDLPKKQNNLSKKEDKMTKVQKVALAGAALAGLTLATSCHMMPFGGKGSHKKGHCYGVNSCRGTGACGGKYHSCSGKNSCKGKGFLKLSEKSCKNKGGKFRK